MVLKYANLSQPFSEKKIGEIYYKSEIELYKDGGLETKVVLT